MKTYIFKKKLVYLSLLISELSEMVFYEFWYDCVKSKYVEKAKLCHINSDSCIVFVI